jgi:putative membrane protein
MTLLATILIALIALIHLYICWFEMFAWESRGPRIFRNFPKDLFTPTNSMAANQGLYNAFLAAGLIWSLLISDAAWAQNIALFFLLCVAVAGIYGAACIPSDHLCTNRACGPRDCSTLVGITTREPALP